jgi:hypothetical protein
MRMSASPASEKLAGLCVLERRFGLRDEGLLLRWTADHDAAAYEGSRCAES